MNTDIWKEDPDKGYRESKKAYLRRQDISQQDVHRYRILQNYLKRMWIASNICDLFSPLSSDILNALPTLAFVPAFLQLWTYCRFNELEQISLRNIKFNEPFKIQSSKSDHSRSVPQLPNYNPAGRRLLNPHTKILVVSYDSYLLSIKNAKALLDIKTPKSILDCTHIFRHIEATWLSKKGLDLPEISFRLGHSNDKTTIKYIHKSWDV